MLAAEFTGGYPSFGFAENTDDLFVGKTLLHGDVLMWLMKTLLTSGCTNQRGAGQMISPIMLGPLMLKRDAFLFIDDNEGIFMVEVEEIKKKYPGADAWQMGDSPTG
jgi:mannose-6-phosphate isomerase